MDFKQRKKGLIQTLNLPHMGFAQKIGDTVRYPKYTTNLIGKLVFINHCGFGVSCIRFSDKPSYQISETEVTPEKKRDGSQFPDHDK